MTPEDALRIVYGFTPEQKLAAAVWVFDHIADQISYGGTYRYLIYDRMGFGPEAYLPLYQAGGMLINNVIAEWDEGQKKGCGNAETEE